MMPSAALCLSLLACSMFSRSVQEGLTDKDLDIIRARGSSGRCGSSVKVELFSDGIAITVSGLPDHQFACVNPNTPTEFDVTYTFPYEPSIAWNGPYSLPPGPIGIAINGVAFFNPLTAEGKNAVAGSTAELFDCCYGHSTEYGQYHYHKQPCSDTCDNPVCHANNMSLPQFIGVAFDGLPICTEWDGLDLNQLDECHGTTMPDGRYAYVAVKDHFPYILGCYKAEPILRYKQPCIDAASGKLCDSRWGTLSEAEVTSTKRGLKRISDDGEQELMSYLHSARQQHTKRSTKARQASPDDCYSSTCGQASGSIFSNGQCSAQPGGGYGGSRPGYGGPPQGGAGGSHPPTPGAGGPPPPGGAGDRPRPGGYGRNPPPKQGRLPKQGRRGKYIAA